MKKYLLFLPFMFCTTAKTQSTVVLDSLFSPSIGAVTRYNVVLPEGYSRSEERYPVLYLLHGVDGDHTNWIQKTDVVNAVRSMKVIIVTPDGRNGWYSNSLTDTTERNEDQIIADVIPDAERKYRVISNRYYRGIAGLSMGGYGALKFGLKYYDRFFFAAGISSSIQFPDGLLDPGIVARRSAVSTKKLRSLFGTKKVPQWDNENVFELAARSDGKRLPYFYLSIGSQDGIIELAELNHAFAAVLRNAGAQFEMHEVPGGHDWAFWDKELKFVLHRFNEQLGKR